MRKEKIVSTNDIFERNVAVNIAQSPLPLFFFFLVGSGKCNAGFRFTFLSSELNKNKMVKTTNNSARLQPLVDALASLFSAKYLYDPAHDLLRMIVSPADHAEMKEPPLIPLKNLLYHAEIAAVVAALVPQDADEGKKLEALEEAASSTAGIHVTKIKREGESDAVAMVRRGAFLRPEEDPALRSVFVRPVHPDATAEEISSFFSSFGPVEDVTQRTKSGAVMAAAAVIVFASVDAARACVAASANKSLTYGALPTPLGQHFIPKLTAKMIGDHLQQVAEQARVAEQKQLHSNIVEARRELDAAASEKRTEASLSEAATSSSPFEVKRVLAAGKTLKCENLPDGVTWQEIKANLGNLSLSQPVLKGAVSLVHILEKGGGGRGSGSSSSLFPTRTAIVVFKTSAAVEQLITMYSLASFEYMDVIRKICPKLGRLTDQQETWVRAQYPNWMEKQTESKVKHHRKRARD